MAITQAMCTSFKQGLLTAQHNFTTGGDVFKLALFTSSATLSAATTDYSTSNEASGTNYTAGGGALTNVTPTTSSTTALTDFSDLVFTDATITARGALIYNTTAGAGTGTTDSVIVLDFGSDKTSTAGDFTIVFPAAAASTAIIRVA